MRILDDLQATHTTQQLLQLAFSLVSLFLIIRRFRNARSKVRTYRASGVTPLADPV